MGAITIGRNLAEAFTGFAVLEKTALIYINTQSIGGPAEISREDVEFFHDFFMTNTDRNGRETEHENTELQQDLIKSYLNVLETITKNYRVCLDMG